MKLQQCAATGLLMVVSTIATAQTPALAGTWVGGIYSGGAYAPFRLALNGDTAAAVTADLLAFSFLGFGSADTAFERHAPDVVVIIRDWEGEEHRLQGRVEDTGMIGTYTSYRGDGRFYLRHIGGAFDRDSPAPASTGLFRDPSGDLVAIRMTPDGDLIVAEFSTGRRRLAIRAGPRTYVHGRAYDDWREDGGTIRVASTRADGAAAVLVWDRRRPDGGRASDTLTRVGVLEYEVRFASDGFSLAGTLIVPPGRGPFPALVFVHGSGAATRETNRELGYFAASRGVAALIFDKRGVGQSGGSLQAATVHSLARDGAAALRFLQTRTDTAPRCIGVLGTSQGGWVAPLMAAIAPDVAFIVTVSGPGVASDRQELYRRTLNLRGVGYIPGRRFPEPDVERAVDALQTFFAWVRTGDGGDAVARMLRRIRSEAWFPVTELPDSLDPEAPPSFVPSFRAGMRFDVAGTWRAVSAPSLQLFGGLDPFVPVDESVTMFHALLRPGSAVLLFPTADHWMYERDPGSPRLPSPGYALGYLEAVGSWLDRVIRDRCR